MRSDKYEVLSGLHQSNRTFLLTGYVEDRFTSALESLLTARFNCIVEFSVPDESEDVPVALKNNAFSAPLESVIESYSLPGKGEDDPTLPVSIFYYVLFGLMLSDAAYGMIMAIGCAVILKKFKNMEDSMRKNHSDVHALRYRHHILGLYVRQLFR
jgi:V/A-type H+-transporting ATPase subunit I